MFHGLNNKGFLLQPVPSCKTDIISSIDWNTEFQAAGTKKKEDIVKELVSHKCIRYKKDIKRADIGNTDKALVKDPVMLKPHEF